MRPKNAIPTHPEALNKNFDAFRCLGCDQTIPHPRDETDCETTDEGLCIHLSQQGARPVWAGISVAWGVKAARKRDLLMIRGGWLCVECAKRYGYP